MKGSSVGVSKVKLLRISPSELSDVRIAE